MEPSDSQARLLMNENLTQLTKKVATFNRLLASMQKTEAQRLQQVEEFTLLIDEWKERFRSINDEWRTTEQNLNSFTANYQQNIEAYEQRLNDHRDVLEADVSATLENVNRALERLEHEIDKQVQAHFRTDDQDRQLILAEKEAEFRDFTYQAISEVLKEKNYVETRDFNVFKGYSKLEGDKTEAITELEKEKERAKVAIALISGFTSASWNVQCIWVGAGMMFTLSGLLLTGVVEWQEIATIGDDIAEWINPPPKQKEHWNQ